MPKPNELNIEEFKMDPRLWLRLATPLDGSSVLGNVFTDKENPFLKNPEAAMAKIQGLASEGKLFLRDKGRIRHFREVTMTEDGLKIGDKREMKFGNIHADLPLRILMWFSKQFFRGLGWNGISNWFEERLSRARETIKLNDQYKNEYKEMSDIEKQQLKALRKHEKNLKKLEKIQNDVLKTQQALDKLQGTNSKGEIDSPLNSKPPLETDKSNMQPTHLGDLRPHEKGENKQLPKDDLKEENPENKPIEGKKKEEGDKKDEPQEIVLNNVRITEENMKQLPPNVQESLKVILNFVEQQKAIERDLAQKQQQQQPLVNEIPEALNNEQQIQEILNTNQNELLIDDETEIKQDNHLINENNNQQINQTIQTNPADILIDADPNEHENAQRTGDNIVNHDDGNLIDADAEQLNNNSQPQRNDVNRDNSAENKQPEPTTLEQRLAAEKQSIDAISKNNWREFVTNFLMSHEDAKQLREMFESIKNDRGHHSTVLTGMLFGVLTNNTGGQERKQQVMDTFLNGQPLGRESNKLVNDSLENYNNAVVKLQGGNKKDFESLITNAVLELGRQASMEKELSPRHVVIAQMISNAVTMKNKYGLTIALDDDQLQMVQGASEMGKLAKRYFEARQFFGTQPMDMTQENSRVAMADLLAGTAINSMLKADHDAGEVMTKTQMMMGKKLWSASNLRVLAGSTQTMKDINQQQLQSLLENPHDFNSAKIGNQVSTGMLAESIAIQNEVDNAVRQNEMNLANEQQLQQQQTSNMPF